MKGGQFIHINPEKAVPIQHQHITFGCLLAGQPDATASSEGLFLDDEYHF
jgi:hypothetical protein